jgi:hypothetical protein
MLRNNLGWKWGCLEESHSRQSQWSSTLKPQSIWSLRQLWALFFYFNFSSEYSNSSNYVTVKLLVLTAINIKIKNYIGTCVAVAAFIVFSRLLWTGTQNGARWFNQINESIDGNMEYKQYHGTDVIARSTSTDLTVRTRTRDHRRPTRDQNLDADIVVLIHTPAYRSIGHWRQVARLIGVRFSRVQPIWTLSVRSRRPTDEWRVLWSWDQRLMSMHKCAKFKRNSQSRDKTPTKSCGGVGVVHRSLAKVARPSMTRPSDISPKVNLISLSSNQHLHE